jgi:hypothetical protein
MNTGFFGRPRYKNKRNDNEITKTTAVRLWNITWGIGPEVSYGSAAWITVQWVGSSSKWVVSFTPLQLYSPGERAPRIHWLGGWVGPTAGLEDMEKWTFFTLPGLELRPLGRPARSQSLYRLSYRGCHGIMSSSVNCFLRHISLAGEMGWTLCMDWGRRNEYNILVGVSEERKLIARHAWDNIKTKTNKLHGLSPRANYTDRATSACRRSDCQLVRIEGATWSAWRILPAVFSVF